MRSSFTDTPDDIAWIMCKNADTKGRAIMEPSKDLLLRLDPLFRDSQRANRWIMTAAVSKAPGMAYL
jgi:hypothetical protein